MTEARQIISDLETSKTYLVRAEVVDKNLGVVVGESVAVVATPADSSIPGEIDSTTPGAFLLFSNSKSVMFRFNAPLDKDISGYDYEIYATNSLSGLLLASGQSYTTVFTVILDNTEAVPADLEGPPKIFYGRVRAFDTSGNKGSYTPLIASKPTLVDSAEISDLTATKIKAGTITSSIINLDGANSVIRSSNYTTGTDGWAIRGDGTAEFSAGVIRGTVKAGSLFIDANNRWKSDATGATISIPEFKVGSSTQYVSWDGNTLTVQGTLKFPDGTTPGTFDDGDAITGGSVAGLTINSSKIFFGTGTYGNTSTAFYVDNTGKFSLGDKLTWDGSALTIQGTLKFPDGTTPGTFDDGDAITGGSVAGLTINSNKIFFGTGTHSNSSTAFYVDNTGKFSLGDKLTWDGSTLSISGNVVITGGSTLASINNAQNTANNAQNAANNAQDTADDAQSTANTANTAANNAQVTADGALDAADSAFNVANNALPASTFNKAEIVKTINNSTNSTKIHGAILETGTVVADAVVADFVAAMNIRADQITAGTITASISMNAAEFNGGSININNEFRVGSSGSVNCRNITIDSGLAYRGESFASSGDTTTARIQQLSGVQRITQPASNRDIKKNIQDISGALEIVKALKPRIFNFNETYYGEIDPSTEEPWTSQAKELHQLFQSYGFIVEEVQEVNPQLVTYCPVELGSLNISTWKPKMWKDLEIIAILTKAVQELSDKVEELESRTI